MTFSPEIILITYIALFLIQQGFSIVLDILNIKHVKTNSLVVPAYLRGKIEEDTYQKSVSYTLTKLHFGFLSSIVLSLVLLLFVVSGGFGFFDRIVASLHLGIFTHGVLYVVFVSFFFSVIEIPFNLYSTFVIEERFGFNKTTGKLWAIDFFKSLILSLVLSVPLLCALFWFMGSTGPYWWIYAWGFILAVQLILFFIYPIWIAPIFNTFTPLENDELKESVEKLAGKANFHTSGIYSMDGSRRSKHANAYFTGFGKNKRIVLFDTLLEILSVKEILAVLAHEIGHEKKQHIKKMFFFSALLMGISFYIVDLLLFYDPLYQAFGFNGASFHAALVVLSFASAPITFFISPLFSILSRKHEYQADRFAVEMVGNPEDLSNALVNLSKESLANFNPHPWYSFFHYSHPTLAERLYAMNEK